MKPKQDGRCWLVGGKREEQELQFKKGKVVSINSKKEIEQIIHNSRKYHTPNFLLSVRRADHNLVRFAIVIPKKKVKSAVARNRLKRLVREVFITESSKLAGRDLLCLLKKSGESEKWNYSTVYNQIKPVLDKIESDN